MEAPTHILILFFFLIILISIIGLSLSGARIEIRTLRARLDRRDALDVKRNNANKRLEAELEALEHTIALKDETIKSQCKDITTLVGKIFIKDETIKAQKTKLDEAYKHIQDQHETIKHLDGDIAKLKFDYAAEVAGRNETKYSDFGGVKPMTLEEVKEIVKPAPLRGEWVDDSEPKKASEEKGCPDPDCSVCYGDKNAESPNLDEEVDD